MSVFTYKAASAAVGAGVFACCVVGLVACGRSGFLPTSAEDSSGADIQASQAAQFFARLPPVLMYHEISATPTSGSDVSVAEFQKQMDWLNAQGYKTLSAKEFEDIALGGQTAPTKSVLITFDDGYAGNYANAKVILENRKMKAVFFVHTDYVGVKTGSHPHMTWDELKELESSPLFEVHSHTRTHPKLTSLTDEQMRNEIGQSQVILNKQLGAGHVYFAYPFGDYNAKVIHKLMGYNYKLGFAVQQRGTFGLPARYSIPRRGVGISTSLGQFKALVQ